MVAFLVLVVFLLSAYVLFFAMLGLWIPKFHKTDAGPGTQPDKSKFLIFVPAHNESGYLRPTLQSLHSLNYSREQFHIVVIADNCTDDTALIGKQEGCEVWERIDPKLCGKGHALAWAFKAAQKLSYDAVVIIDADTTVSANLLQVLDHEIRQSHLVIQVRYSFEFPMETSRWFRLISQASKRSEDSFISRPRSRFRLYQGLQGNGFCLHHSVLEDVPWTAGSICEDLEYGLSLSEHGFSVHYVEDACVTAAMTGRLEHASGQRQRWAGGTFALIVQRIPTLISQGIRRPDWRSIEACPYLITLSRLPLVLLSAITASILLLEWHAASRPWLFVFCIAILMQVIYAIAMLSTTRNEHGFGKTLLGLPIYAVWLAYQQCASLLSLRNASWNRTERG
ncbi:MAG TPA: glycosyltransferase family 2 protein [Acidobacteriaceae bacterium]|jgi:cellulose synthase/poly-beta-1,6-N-acetylglucosamine synthase-like glycosyltransferase|nr:glycosyltransferase family 2 protein [Acidobacteriaceae bacterium]